MNWLELRPVWISCILLTASLVVYEVQEKPEGLPVSKWASGQVVYAETMGGEEGPLLQQTETNARPDTFIPMEGGTLLNRIRRARDQGQSGQPETRYWVAYGFDVIPGVAVDMELVNTNGSTNSFTMMSGGFETRRLALFSLYNPGDKEVVRVEIYNLAGERNYNGYPVYWLGDTAADEGVAYLTNLLQGHQGGRVGDRIIMGMALHDDPTASRQLRQIVQSDMANGRRASAVSWLGHRGEASTFFASLIENEREAGHIRKNAVSAMARQGDNETLVQLQALYKKVENTEVKKRIISSLSYDRFGDAAGTFYRGVARDAGENREIRKQAISRLTQSGNTAHRLDLIDLYDQEVDRKIRSRILSALTQMDLPAATEKLIHIARESPDTDQRKRAIRSLDHHDEESILLMASLYDSELSSDVQSSILDILGASHHTKATTKLIDISKTTTSEKLRKKATYWLGKSNDPKAVRFFEEMFKN